MNRGTQKSSRAKTTRRAKPRHDAAASRDGDASDHAQRNGTEPHHEDQDRGGALYWISYRVSFAVVYPIAMVGWMIPKDNPIVHGLMDGARAAHESIFGGHEHALEGSREDTEALEAQPA